MGFSRSFLMSSLLVISACGAGERGDDDVVAPDAGVAADARPGVPFVVYVHTRDTLYALEPEGWSLRMIGSFGLGQEFITDLAVDTEGRLFGVSQTKLYSIDATSGAASYIADVPGAENVGLTFLKTGQLLATDKSGGVRSINLATGQTTEIGSFGGGFATAGDLVAVADGTMYALSDEGPNGDEFENNWLLRVDTATGVATPIKQIGYGKVFGAGFINGKLIAFTSLGQNGGQIIGVDPDTAGPGELLATSPVEFWGAGVTPLVPID